MQRCASGGLHDKAILDLTLFLHAFMVRLEPGAFGLALSLFLVEDELLGFVDLHLGDAHLLLLFLLPHHFYDILL